MCDPAHRWGCYWSADGLLHGALRFSHSRSKNLSLASTIWKGCSSARNGWFRMRPCWAEVCPPGLTEPGLESKVSRNDARATFHTGMRIVRTIGSHTWLLDWTAQAGAQTKAQRVNLWQVSTIHGLIRFTVYPEAGADYDENPVFAIHASLSMPGQQWVMVAGAHGSPLTQPPPS